MGTTFESQPAVSRADTSCMGASLAATSEQSAFESNPAASKADITWTTEVTASGDGPSVFESAPQAHTASVTYADEVRPEQSDVSVFGNDTSQSVFESQPKESVANARSGAEGDGESE